MKNLTPKIERFRILGCKNNLFWKYFFVVVLVLTKMITQKMAQPRQKNRSNNNKGNPSIAREKNSLQGFRRDLKESSSHYQIMNLMKRHHWIFLKCIGAIIFYNFGKTNFYIV